LFSLVYFFDHSFCRKDEFTVLTSKFRTEDFTDPGLLKIRQTLTGLLLWTVLPSQVFLIIIELHMNFKVLLLLTLIVVHIDGLVSTSASMQRT